MITRPTCHCSDALCVTARAIQNNRQLLHTCSLPPHRLHSLVYDPPDLTRWFVLGTSGSLSTSVICWKFCLLKMYHTSWPVRLQKLRRYAVFAMLVVALGALKAALSSGLFADAFSLITPFVMAGHKAARANALRLRASQVPSPQSGNVSNSTDVGAVRRHSHHGQCNLHQRVQPPASSCAQ